MLGGYRSAATARVRIVTPGPTITRVAFLHLQSPEAYLACVAASVPRDRALWARSASKPGAGAQALVQRGAGWGAGATTRLIALGPMLENAGDERRLCDGGDGTHVATAARTRADVDREHVERASEYVGSRGEQQSQRPWK